MNAQMLTMARAIISGVFVPSSARKGERSTRFLWRVIICVFACVAPAVAPGAGLPRSVLYLDQNDPGEPFAAGISSVFRSTVNASSGDNITIYAENLDLIRSTGPRHEEVLKTYLRGKYRDRPIGVIVAMGTAALPFMLRVRAELWPEVSAIFAAGIAAETKIPPGVTGLVRRQTLRSSVSLARALMPRLKRIALVGDVPRPHYIRAGFNEEIPALAAEVEIIDLRGLRMEELRQRVAALPHDTVIYFTTLTYEGDRPAFVSRDALVALAEVANRPIIVDLESHVGYGSVGGLVADPSPMGRELARLALRILDGESASNIPVVTGEFVRSIFDWRQLQRWGLSESNVPPGSEVRFRRPSIWEEYHWHVMTALAIVLVQSAMIAWLLVERHRRQLAELKARARLMEVAHLNRSATAGALSASVAHELNQPLGAILSNAEAAEALLAANPFDLQLLKEILADIRRDDHRAGEIIRRLRGLLKNSEIELQEFDLNDAVDAAIHILEPEARKRGVELSAVQAQGALPVRADQVHLQQVIINLVANGLDAMLDCSPDKRRLALQTAKVGESEVEVSVADTGTGVPDDKLKDVFKTFFTTKPQGTGLGLSIARTIIETYGGRIWAENRLGGGAVFRFTLPLAQARSA